MSDQQQPTSRIPEFSSIEEEAEFWDTHDLSEYWDEFRPVAVRFRQGPLAAPLSVRLDRADRAELDRRAGEQGIGPSTLVRVWIKERLRAERAKQPSHG